MNNAAGSEGGVSAASGQIRQTTDPQSGIIVLFNDSFRLSSLRVSMYQLIMNGPFSNSDFRHTREAWQARQKADGRLVAVLAVATVVPVARFFITPGLPSAWVMGIFLFAVCLSCVRLLNSAAMVVKLREAAPVAALAQIVDAEILDVYEYPGAIDFQNTRSTSTYWLATPGWQYTAQPGFGSRHPFASELRPTKDGVPGRASRRLRG